MGSLDYRNLHIFKDQELGHGSYGAVYKAVCDDLPCAAKVLHPTLVHSPQDGVDALMRRFRQECAFMDSIRHPNIVLYLGMTTDPTGLPVLLMELLDESLTSMLESSPEPLPHHIQVDICHDVSLAISYLHSQNILHRDLSSNNVLITAKRKAKVTDFGVSRMVDLEHHSSTPLSLCPGTKAYMPPEALKENAKYNEKIDIFSLGVITIQLITRLFPNPTSATQEIHIHDERGNRLQKIVSEVDRRKAHIDLIDPHNPLLGMIEACLNDDEKNRPQANALCQMLARLKLSQVYLESKRHNHPIYSYPVSNGATGFHQTRDMSGSSETSSLKRRMFEKDKKINEMSLSINKHEESLKLQQTDIDKKKRELVGYASRVQELQHSNRMLLSELQRKEDLLLHKSTEAEGLQTELSRVWREREEYSRVREELVRLKNADGDHKTEMMLKEEEIEQLKKKLRESERITAEFQATIQELSAQLQHAHSPFADFSPSLSPTLKSFERRRSSLDKLKMKWRGVEGSPSSVYRGASAYHNGTVYLASQSKVFAYSMKTHSWTVFPDAPQANGGFVTINDFPTMIGGERNGRVINTLVSLMDTTWIETFPKMPTPRVYSSAVMTLCNSHVIVAGGSSSTRLGEDISAVVEVMEIGELECMWFSVSNLCRPLADASTVVYNSQLMLIGGTDRTGNTTTNQKCSIDELLSSKRKVPQDHQRSLLLRHNSGGSGSFVWRMMTECKLQYSTGVAVKGHLLAIGGTGKDSGKNTCTSFVYRYNELSDSWEKAGLMDNTRSHCFAVCLPAKNELMVVGGYTGNPSKLTNIAEIATLSH